MNIDDLPTVRPREIVPSSGFFIESADKKVNKLLEYSYIANWNMDQLGSPPYTVFLGIVSSLE